MDNKNEGFYTTGEQGGEDQLKDVVNKLETLLRQIKGETGDDRKKRDISKSIKGGMDKTTDAFKRVTGQARVGVDKTTDALKYAKGQAKVGMDKTTDTFKQVKEKFDNIESDKQKMIILTLFSTLISVVTAVAITKCFSGKDKR